MPVSGENIEWLPILEEEILLAVPFTILLGIGIHLKEVETDPFIVMSSGYDFRDMTEHFCNEAGFSPNIAFE